MIVIVKHTRHQIEKLRRQDRQEKRKVGAKIPMILKCLAVVQTSDESLTKWPDTSTFQVSASIFSGNM